MGDGMKRVFGALVLASDELLGWFQGQILNAAPLR